MYETWGSFKEKIGKNDSKTLSFAEFELVSTDIIWSNIPAMFSRVATVGMGWLVLVTKKTLGTGAWC